MSLLSKSIIIITRIVLEHLSGRVNMKRRKRLRREKGRGKTEEGIKEEGEKDGKGRRERKERRRMASLGN